MWAHINLKLHHLMAPFLLTYCCVIKISLSGQCANISVCFTSECVSNVDDTLGEMFLEEKEPTEQDIRVSHYLLFIKCPSFYYCPKFDPFSRQGYSLW